MERFTNTKETQNTLEPAKRSVLVNALKSAIAAAIVSGVVIPQSKKSLAAESETVSRNFAEPRLFQKSPQVKHAISGDTYKNSREKNTHIVAPKKEKDPSFNSVKIKTEHPLLPNVPIQNKTPRMNPESVAGDIDNLEARLRPNGNLMRELENKLLTKERLNSIVVELSNMGGLLTQAEARIIPKHPKLEAHLLSETPPGLVVLMIPVRYANGSIGKVRCGGLRVVHHGKVGIAANEHCINKPGEYVALDRDEWLTSPLKEDFAVKPIRPDIVQSAMSFNESILERQGRLARVDVFTRHNKPLRFYTFAIPMTLPVYKIFFPNEKNKDFEETMMKGYWYPSLPSEQKEAVKGGGANFLGQSGTALFVKSDRGGYTSSGPLFAGLPERAECKDVVAGLCTTIMFSVSPNSVSSTFEAYSMVWDTMVASKKSALERTQVLERKDLPNKL